MADGNRKSAYRVLWDVERKKAYSNLALSSVIEREKPENPSFVRELVYGVLEEQMLLDRTVSRYLKQPFAQLGTAEKLLLRLGFWQLDFARKIPAFAAVSETVNLAKQVAKGREGFINAVLRAYVREPLLPGEEEPKSLALLKREQLPKNEELSVAYSAAPWIVEAWIADSGEEKTEQMLRASHDTPDLVLRPNRLRTGEADAKDMLQKRLPESIHLEEGSICASALHVKGSGALETDAFREGWFSVQDEASQYAVQVLDPQPGEKVYDLCAAPGGKSLAIAERMQAAARDDRAWGQLIACDIHPGKLNQIVRESERLGVQQPTLLVRNAANPDPDPLPPLSAHRVLVDAPCSGLGVLRRKPEIKLRGRDPAWEDLPVKQRAILEQSARLVREGGTLLYSTCTVLKRENQQVVQAFLRDHPEFVPETEHQFFPGEEGTDGFYLCSMKRRKELQ